nr:stage V sporulation protein AA [uncultured Blautia sp.]
MASKNVTLYIKGERNVKVTKPDIYLEDIVSMECSDKTVLPGIRRLKILKISGKKEQRKVLSVLDIITCIHAAYPEVEVQNLGETDMIITCEQQKKTSVLLYGIKVVLVSAIIFFGSAFSIMAFNNDVGGTELFGQIYEQVTGKKSDGFTVLEITYAIGLTVGILVFFNHFGKKRFTADPTPMEIQMRIYENDIQTTLVENASRKKEMQGEKQ